MKTTPKKVNNNNNGCDSLLKTKPKNINNNYGCDSLREKTPKKDRKVSRKSTKEDK
jgi:hypothetical protein